MKRLTVYVFFLSLCLGAPALGAQSRTEESLEQTYARLCANGQQNEACEALRIALVQKLSGGGSTGSATSGSTTSRAIPSATASTRQSASTGGASGAPASGSTVGLPQAQGTSTGASTAQQQSASSRGQPRWEASPYGASPSGGSQTPATTTSPSATPSRSGTGTTPGGLKWVYVLTRQDRLDAVIVANKADGLRKAWDQATTRGGQWKLEVQDDKCGYGAIYQATDGVNRVYVSVTGQPTGPEAAAEARKLADAQAKGRKGWMSEAVRYFSNKTPCY